MGQEKKGNLKGEGPDSESYFTWNILPREVAGTPSPFRGLERGRQVVRTRPRRAGVILGGSLAKFSLFSNHFSSRISIVLESIFVWYLLTQKEKKNSRIVKPITHYSGTILGSTEDPAPKSFPSKDIFKSPVARL